MAKHYLTIEEFHLAIRVPDEMNDAEVNKIRDTLDSSAFIRKLRQAIATVLATHLPPKVVRIRISR